MPFLEVRSAAPNNIENALRDVHRRAAQMLVKQGTGNQLQLLIVILPEVSGSYGKIKRVCDTYIGIVSQCCLPKHASRPNNQYLENIVLKINAKLKYHDPDSVKVPAPSLGRQKVITKDVTHKRIHVNETDSVQSVVRSAMNKLHIWAPDCFFHDGRRVLYHQSPLLSCHKLTT
ncbi:hypothetical protein ACP70R_025342 [Stipagrostis hirtigluma subsp. patula]